MSRLTARPSSSFSGLMPGIIMRLEIVELASTKRSASEVGSPANRSSSS